MVSSTSFVPSYSKVTRNQEYFDTELKIDGEDEVFINCARSGMIKHDIVKLFEEKGSLSSTLIKELALFFATLHGSTGTVETICAMDDIRDIVNSTVMVLPPLFIALDKKDWALMSLLIEGGADVMQVPREGLKPCSLHIAAAHGEVHIVDWLLHKCKNDDEWEQLVNKADANGETPIFAAIRSGSLNLVQYLVEKHRAKLSDFSKKGYCPLFLAIAENSAKEIVQFLTGKMSGLQLANGDGNTAFHIAAAHKNADAIKWLATLQMDNTYVGKSSHDLNEKQQLPLHLAATSGDIITAQTMLEHTDDSFLNTRDQYGNTPLHYATIAKFWQFVQLLLQRNGVIVDIRDNRGNTALHVAVHGLMNKDIYLDPKVSWNDHSKAYFEIIKSLLEKNADAGALNNELMSPLHVAIESGGSYWEVEETTKFLLMHRQNELDVDYTAFPLRSHIKHTVLEDEMSRKGHEAVELHPGLLPYIVSCDVLRANQLLRDGTLDSSRPIRLSRYEHLSLSGWNLLQRYCEMEAHPCRNAIKQIANGVQSTWNDELLGEFGFSLKPGCEVEDVMHLTYDMFLVPSKLDLNLQVTGLKPDRVHELRKMNIIETLPKGFGKLDSAVPLHSEFNDIPSKLSEAFVKRESWQSHNILIPILYHLNLDDGERLVVGPGSRIQGFGVSAQLAMMPPLFTHMMPMIDQCLSSSLCVGDLISAFDDYGFEYMKADFTNVNLPLSVTYFDFDQEHEYIVPGCPAYLMKCDYKFVRNSECIDKVLAKDIFTYDPMSWAIDCCHEHMVDDIAKATSLLSLECSVLHKWMLSSPTDTITQCQRMVDIASNTPDVACKILDHCIAIESLDHCIATESVENTDEAQISVAIAILQNGAKQGKSKTPLNVAVQSDNHSFIQHPVMKVLLWQSWHVVFAFYLSFLLFFLVPLAVLMSTYMAKSNHPSGINRTVCEEYLIEANSSVGEPAAGFLTGGTNGLYSYENEELLIIKWMVTVLTILGLLLEIIQVVAMRFSYFHMHSNAVDVFVYICVILSISMDLTPCGERTIWQWQLGSFAVLVCWMNIIFYMKRLHCCSMDLYITMLSNIVLKCIRLSIVLALFIFAFSFTFFLLLQNQAPFRTMEYSAVKTMTMWLGEMDFANIFHGERTDPSSMMYYEEVTYVVYVMFIFVMPVIMMNLLTGLAVADAGVLMSDAKYNILCNQASYALEMQDCFFFIRKYGPPWKDRFFLRTHENTLRQVILWLEWFFFGNVCRLTIHEEAWQRLVANNNPSKSAAREEEEKKEVYGIIKSSRDYQRDITIAMQEIQKTLKQLQNDVDLIRQQRNS